jgi:hypothetical protein
VKLKIVEVPGGGKAEVLLDRENVKELIRELQKAL